MRITLDIATPVIEALRRIQKRDGGTLDDVVNGLLTEALRRRRAGPAGSAPDWASQPMHARVDLEDKDAVSDILDDRRP